MPFGDGTGPLGNGLEGMALDAGAANNLIGGTAVGSGNTIGYNGSDGVDLKAAAGSGNAILGNTILSNTGLGIDLGQIISVSPRLDYDNAHWKDGYNNKTPIRAGNQFIVEYCAHPAARFTAASRDKLSFAVSDCQRIDADAEASALKPINPADL